MKMKRMLTNNFKRTTVAAMVLFCLALALLAIRQVQTADPEGDYNPLLIQGFVSPAPLLPVEFGGTGFVQFDVGNTGSDAMPVESGDEMTLIVTLSKGVPDNADPLAALSGDGLAWFSWTYDSVIKTYNATQIATIPADSRATIKIDYEVSENSFLGGSPAVSNGFNVALQPPGYTNESNNTDDDTVSSYTYVEAYDYGDLPADGSLAPDGVNSTSYGETVHAINVAKSGGSYTQYVYLGTSVDIETAYQGSTGADGDDVNQTANNVSPADDEDGVTFPTMSPGDTVDIPVVVTIEDSGYAFVNAWIDWDGSGVFDSDEQITPVGAGLYVVASGTYNITVTVPPDAITTAPTYARFRIGAVVGSSGSTTYGEVEDYLINIEGPEFYDWGDLPATYPTLSTSSGANHLIDGATYLGTAVDDETNGQPTAAADGDDTIGTSDDEDGVLFLTPLIPGTTADIQVTIADGDGTGYLSAFIDFDGDGTLDPVTLAAGGTISDLALSSGVHTLTINVPSNATGAMPSRFRLTNESGEGGNSPTGAASTGEVEDYILASVGNRIWQDANDNGIQDPLETPLIGIQINLLDQNGNPVVDADGNPITTFSDDIGNFEFPGLIPDDSYILEFVPPSGGGFTPTNVGENPTVDSDANVADGRTAILTLDPGQINVDIDAGFNSSTTPVTLVYFTSIDNAGTVRFEWSTSTEIANVGFNLYVETPDGRQLINEEIILSLVGDSLDRQDYSYEAAVNGSLFFIEDVDIYGEIESFGPFELGEEYGYLEDPDPIDWQTIHDQNDDVENVRRGGWTHRSYPPVNMLVDREGIYRVTYGELLDAGIDLGGVPARNLAVTNLGQPVSIVIGGPQGAFGPGNYIEFYGQPVVDNLYTDENVYIIVVDKTLASRIDVDGTKIPKNGTPSVYYMETTVHNENLRYDRGSLTDDPWYDERMYAVNETAWDFILNVDNSVNGAAPASLTVGVKGASTWSSDPDHHMIVSFNAQQISEEFFDGKVSHVVSSELPNGLVQEGENTLTLVLPHEIDTRWDLIYFDKAILTYPRAYAALDNSLIFNSADSMFSVTGLASDQVVVYRVDSQTGQVWSLRNVEIEAGDSDFTATFGGSKQADTYLVSTIDGLLKPRLKIAKPAEDINTWPAQFLIIAHGNFIEGLQPLVEARQAQGMTVQVVDTESIYQLYSHSIFDAQAIKDYISYAAANLGTEYVLLVGADTYDYKDYLGTTGFSFLPSLYARTDQYVTYAPVDPLYTDLDNDGVPNLPIGRFPVRLQEELDAVVTKTLQYQNREYGERNAVLVADKYFGFDGESFAQQLGQEWQIDRAFLDKMSVSEARQMLLDAINNGTALTSYVGHSGPTNWSYSRDPITRDPLFVASDAAGLNNYDRPTVFTQYGCWNTYYVNPTDNTMGHKLMLSGTNGGAAILGATTLTKSSSERALGDLLIPRLTQPGKSLGQAIQEAKMELDPEDSDLTDVLLGWTLLGDPTLVIQP